VTKSQNVTIPISDLKNFSFVNDKITFTTFANTIRNNDYLSNYISFEFESLKETDIIFRMKLAFVHLAKYYYKSVSNEPF
jgi:hypothetical protein